MADPSAPPPNCVVPLDLMSLYGPQLIGLAFSCALWGMGCLQTFFYFFTYDSDGVIMRYFVAFVWALETANEGVIVAGVFPPLIQNWGSVAKLDQILGLEIHRTWISTLVGFMVQMFYLYRIYQFTMRKTAWTMLAISFLVLLALFQVVGAGLYTAWALPLPSGADLFTHRMMALSITLRAVTAVVDIAIAGWMTFLLATSRSSIWTKSNKLVFQLMILTVNSGTWTALFAILDLSLIAGLNNQFWFVLFEQPLAALYVNALLATLNARRFLRDGRSTEINFSPFGAASGGSGTAGIPMGSMESRAMRSTGSGGKADQAIAIRIDTATVANNDAHSYASELGKDQFVATGQTYDG